MCVRARASVCVSVYDNRGVCVCVPCVRVCVRVRVFVYTNRLLTLRFVWGVSWGSWVKVCVFKCGDECESKCEDEC